MNQSLGFNIARGNERRMRMNQLSFLPIIIALLFASFVIQGAERINISEVRNLAKLPVDQILKGSPVETIPIEDYWNSIHGRKKPLVVFFYINSNGPSQRIATLIKYVTPHYQDRMSFRRLKVAETGLPDKVKAARLVSEHGLDKIPGLLFYDNVGTDMVLEDEDYIDPDFKEFRSPKMFLWKTYYSVVQKELDKLLAD